MALIAGGIVDQNIGVAMRLCGGNHATLQRIDIGQIAFNE